MRRYLPTLFELIDRLSICQLKKIYIEDNRDAYELEIKDILHDIDVIIKERGIVLTGGMIRAVQMIMLSNRVIWENESRARLGESDQDALLKFTHSINGIRNAAKNVVSNMVGDRVDLKIDCFASNLPEELGNWRIDEDDFICDVIGDE